MTKESTRNTYKIYVGNLSPLTTDNDLCRVFGLYGTVVEAVALSAKGFGFVHMTSEKDAHRAMEYLNKYHINGKEMLVQPAINPKKAQGQFGSRRATIGKGVSTLDDFEDYSEYDNYLDQEIANHIGEPPASVQPSNSSYNPYTNGASNTVLGGQVVGNNLSMVNVRTPDKFSSVNTAANGDLSRPHLTNLDNNSYGGSVNGFHGTNGLVNNVSSCQSLVTHNNSNNSLDVSAAWGPESLLASMNSSLGQFDASQALNNSIISDKSQVNCSSPQSNSYGLSVLADSNNVCSSSTNKLMLMTQQLHQLQAAAQNNPNNPQVTAAVGKLQQEITLLQSQQSLEGHVAKEQAKIQQDSLQRILLQQHQLHQQQYSNSLNGNTIPPPLNLGNLSTACVTSLPSRNGLSSGLSTSNMSSMSSNKKAPACRICNEAYNMEGRIPKILSCTHTFCLLCLHVMPTHNGHLVCPEHCGVSTALSTAGVAGLTTNHAILSSVEASSQRSYNNNIHSVDSLSTSMDVCATCAVTMQEMPLNMCRDAGHTLIRPQDANPLIVAKLKPLIHETNHNLKQVLALRSTIKQRAEWTLASLNKFMDELKSKRERDEADDNMLYGTQHELAKLAEQLDSLPYLELVRSFHLMDKCAKDIQSQYSQCLIASCVNESVKSVMLEIQPKFLPKVYQLGIKRDEVFEMDRSIQSHAQDGNYANVLLQYLVCDLLSSRVNVHNRATLIELLNSSYGESSSLPSAVTDCNGDLRSTASVTPPCSEAAGPLQHQSAAASCNDIVNGVYRSLTTSSSATPDITAMNNGALDPMTNCIDNLDINCLIQTTEAIEAESRGVLNTSEMPAYTDLSTSLGLSNICQIASDDSSLEHLDSAKLLEGSARIDCEPCMKIESSAPSPNSSDSITPPIVGNAARSSMDTSSLSSDSGISGSCNNIKPFSYLDAAKKPAKPQAEPAPKTDVVKLTTQIKQIKTPHCWMKITVDGESIGRIVFQLRPDKAPKMCENFLGLCTGKPGYGYQGTHFFKNGEGFLAGGDVEYDDGSGGYSIYGKKKFEADLCPLKDEVGMIRFKGNGTSETGRGMVGSQFMVWYAEREFKKFSYSLVFGRVVDGLDVVKKAANVNLAKHDVMIEESGGIM